MCIQSLFSGEAAFGFRQVIEFVIGFEVCTVDCGLKLAKPLDQISRDWRGDVAVR
jgi:hypothetical protein